MVRAFPLEHGGLWELDRGSRLQHIVNVLNATALFPLE